MDDLIERLRENNPEMPTRDRFEAAVEIERLRAIIVADTHVLLSRRPVAFRVGSNIDGWILYRDERTAYDAANARNATIQGLYARDGK